MNDPKKLIDSALRVQRLVEDANVHLQGSAPRLIEISETLQHHLLDIMGSATALLLGPNAETYQKLEASTKAAIEKVREMGLIDKISPDLNGYGVEAAKSFEAALAALASAEAASAEHVAELRKSSNS